MVGQVIWFRSRKGFGFIRHHDDQHVYVHYSVIDPHDTVRFKKLYDDEIVEYEYEKGPDGLHATKVTRLPQNVQRELASHLAEAPCNII